MHEIKSMRALAERHAVVTGDRAAKGQQQIDLGEGEL